MALRSSSSSKTLSFNILSRSSSLGFDNTDEDESLLLFRSISDPSQNGVVSSSPDNNNNNNNKKKNRKKRNKKKKNNNNKNIVTSIPEDDGIGIHFYSGGGGTATVTVVEEEEQQPEEKSVVSVRSYSELRQRNVNCNNNNNDDGIESDALGCCVPNDAEEAKEVINSIANDTNVQNVNTIPNGKLETAESLDWKRLMAEDPNFLFSVDNSPVKYFMDEMYNGNSLRGTTTLGNEKERERVYDTIFRLPWRCEWLINVGFFVCFDSFLSLFTIMPMRILMTLWSLVAKRQFRRPSAAELADFGCFIVLVSGATLLQRTDISLIYHMIRGQGTIKLYVVYNVLEIFDKLCQSFGGDVLETLFNSADELANCSPESIRFWILRFIFDLALAMASSIFHSFVLLAQAITLSTCIIAHNNALLALLVSNNFAEIKGNVFKRFSRDNIHSLVYADSVERFHISAFLLFVLAQNIREAEGPWFQSFIYNAYLVFFCEMLIDIIKHSFLAKFNNLRPIAYSEFLEDLCKQTLNIQNETGKNKLTFVPLAPACVVIRVLTPVYAAHLPYNPLPWRIFWILLLTAVTYIMLTSLKIMIGMGLQKHATWYVNRCRRRQRHLHSD